MIKITSIINSIPEFNHSKFTVVKYEEALTRSGAYLKGSKWFDSYGRYLGDTDESACAKAGLEPRELEVKDYYAVNHNEYAQYKNMGEAVAHIEDSLILGANEETEID